MTDDEIAQAFETISVEDFLRDTSAMGTIKYTPEQERFTTGRNNFMGFVDAQILRCHERAEGPGFHAFSTLHSRSEQRHYHPDDDETAPQYAKRLAREAQEMHATWFFTAMLAPGRAYDPDQGEPPDIDPDDPEQLQEALASGLVHLSICWFAESTDDNLIRSGIIILDDGKPVHSVEGQIDPEANPFQYVLGDHA